MLMVAWAKLVPSRDEFPARNLGRTSWRRANKKSISPTLTGDGVWRILEFEVREFGSLWKIYQQQSHTALLLRLKIEFSYIVLAMIIWFLWTHESVSYCYLIELEDGTSNLVRAWLGTVAHIQWSETDDDVNDNDDDDDAWYSRLPRSICKWELSEPPPRSGIRLVCTRAALLTFFPFWNVLFEFLWVLKYIFWLVKC